MTPLRLAMIGFVFLCLSALGCKKKETDEGKGGDAKKTAELIVGKWKNVSNGTIITLEFNSDKVLWAKKKDGSGPAGEGTYKVIDAHSVEIPKLAAAFDEKVTIDSISPDKLVLSGGETWKFDKTEFTRPAAPANPKSESNKEIIVGAWQIVKTGDNGWAPGDVMEFFKDGTMKGIADINNKTVTFGYTYAVDGGKLTYTRMSDKASDTWTIETLVSDKLVLTSVTDPAVKIEMVKKGSGPGGTNQDKIVGVWETPKTQDFPFDVSLEFRANGTMKLTAKATPPIIKENKYNVDGDKMTMIRTEGGKEMKDTANIKSLTDKVLIITDSKGKTTEYKKK